MSDLKIRTFSALFEDFICSYLCFFLHLQIESAHFGTQMRCTLKLMTMENIAPVKKHSLKDIRCKRHLMKVSAPAQISSQVEVSPSLVGLRTRRPTLRGVRSLVTIKGNVRPYIKYLEGSDVSDMAKDWRLVGRDIRFAMVYFKM